MGRTATIANIIAHLDSGDGHAAKMAFIGARLRPTEAEAVGLRGACERANIHPSHFGAEARQPMDVGAVALRAGVLFGVVPAYPSESSFHMAVSRAVGSDDLAAHWQLEAIRWRRSHGGEVLNLPHIYERAVARRGRAA